MKTDWTRVFQYICAAFNAAPVPWFLCFGSLLTMVRDKGKFGEDDLDIGVMYDEFEPRYVENFCESSGWQIDKKIIHDVDKKVLFMSISPKADVQTLTGPIHVDIFCWYLHEGIYYHTYDVDMEWSKVPSRYVFKGVEKSALESFVGVDNIADSMMCAKIPLRYGTLLDEWYTDASRGYHWLDKRKCVSDTRFKLEMKSCSGFSTGKYQKVKWPNE